MEDSLPIPRIPESNRKRVVIIGGGFAGLKLAMLLPAKLFQVILLDRNNFIHPVGILASERKTVFQIASLSIQQS